MTFTKPFIGKDFSFRVVQTNARESHGLMFLSWISSMFDHALCTFLRTSPYLKYSRLHPYVQISVFICNLFNATHCNLGLQNIT
jgi:hypothetical protein